MSTVNHYNQRFSIPLNISYGDSLMDTRNNNTSLLNDKMVDMKFI
ncbi:AlpA family transcriptional regulator, partial [Salmonella enterica]|nr:AlpA family transcriptional regulator [Salmonella enterica]